MGTQYKQAYCNDCNRLVRAERIGTERIVHLVLSIITFGLWLPLWGVATTLAMLNGFQCPNCGGNNLKRKLFGLFEINQEQNKRQVIEGTTPNAKQSLKLVTRIFNILKPVIITTTLAIIFFLVIASFLMNTNKN